MSVSEIDILSHDPWLARFHFGERRVLRELYEKYFSVVQKEAGRILPGLDKESVVHEVFLRIFSERKIRENFKGGSMTAWIRTITRNQAVDYLRRRKKEIIAFPDVIENQSEEGSGSIEDRLHAKMLIERFCSDCLPAKWRGVFEARFLRRLNQQDVAKELGIPRTTVAYREHRIRKLLRRFLENGE